MVIVALDDVLVVSLGAGLELQVFDGRELLIVRASGRVVRWRRVAMA